MAEGTSGETTVAAPARERARGRSLGVRALRLLQRGFVGLIEFLIILPWELMVLGLRLLYGFRVEGAENVPRSGPFIAVFSEFNLFCVLSGGWTGLRFIRRVVFRAPDKATSYMHAELFRFAYFRALLCFADLVSPLLRVPDENEAGEAGEAGVPAGGQSRGRAKLSGALRPLLPYSAGKLALNLLEGYQSLQKGGVVVLNPEGDLRLDGRPLPVKDGAAWLALHTGAPILPMNCSASTYDIWPAWRFRPSLRGRMVMRMGVPFTLCDAPQRQVAAEDLARGSARIEQELARLRYGPGGLDEWIGTPLRDGEPVVEFPRTGAPRPGAAAPRPSGESPLQRGGLAMLLWRCPVCRTDEALVHRDPLFRPGTLSCRACGTRWEVRRVAGHDFRLRVVQGAPEWLGLDAAVCRWYDEMMGSFELQPIPAPGVTLQPGEEVYLQADSVGLLPCEPNRLLEAWDGREPPRVQSTTVKTVKTVPQVVNWVSVGRGRLLATSRRLLWQGAQGELDFAWPFVTSVTLWMPSTLSVRYGTAPYRFALGQETGMKWLAFVGTLARRQAQASGRTLTLSAF